MTLYRPVFVDNLEGMFLVHARNQDDARQAVYRWLNKLEPSLVKYFTGSEKPVLETIEEYFETEEGIVIF